MPGGVEACANVLKAASVAWRTLIHGTERWFCEPDGSCKATQSPVYPIMEYERFFYTHATAQRGLGMPTLQPGSFKPVGGLCGSLNRLTALNGDLVLHQAPRCPP